MKIHKTIINYLDSNFEPLRHFCHSPECLVKASIGFFLFGRIKVAKLFEQLLRALAITSQLEQLHIL